MPTWKVQIPAGYWMAGVLTFKTKREAAYFIENWTGVQARQFGTAPTLYPIKSAARWEPIAPRQAELCA